MTKNARISPILRRFEDRETEREFQKFVFDDNLATHRLGIAVGVPLFSLYGFLDFVNLSNPLDAIAVRASAALVCIGIFAAMAIPRLSRHHEWLTMAAVMTLGSAMIYIIWREPSLDNAYYVGLIQVGVFLTFLSRVAFYKAIIPLFLLLGLFVAAVNDKADAQEATLQSFILATMFAICAFGIVVSDNLRRKDFLKARIIRRQNEKLNELLKEARDDNARKVAALNLLVHYVKTPIHQIVGFTDLIAADVSRGTDAPPQKANLQNASFLRDASRELAQNVSRLLAYYRLDDRSSSPPETIDIRERARDYLDRISAAAHIRVRGEPAPLVAESALIDAAFGGLVDYFSGPAFADCAIEAEIMSEPGVARVRIRHSGPAMSAGEFEALTRPIEYIGEYLAAHGSSFPLSLRTTARAAALCGGALRLVEDGRAFELSFRAASGSGVSSAFETEMFAA